VRTCVKVGYRAALCTVGHRAAERPSALPLTARDTHMDLNYLYHRRGQSLIMAVHAACEPSRAAHLALANGYVAKITALRLMQREAAVV